ncbi:CNP1-like family protein [Polaromonas sp.]|uniref:CNP1-like family protein n=1 Tax=Polaromonas sp. TaxID=1869339 RepID=UPI0025E37673|nr:CNP1-like family protein [Polaromonas sp.]
MIIKSLVMACLVGLSATAWAQRDVDLLDWKEEAVPPPPAFDTGKLLTFDVLQASSLVFGVDPATLRISKDGVLSYVMVATSASGARNVLYEGIRCVTGEVKTHARYSPSGSWTPVTLPEWRSMFDNMPSKHALAFARAGACDNSAQASSVDEVVRRLKLNRSGRFSW